jgi:hypothetical protein
MSDRFTAPNGVTYSGRWNGRYFESLQGDHERWEVVDPADYQRVNPGKPVPFYIFHAGEGRKIEYFNPVNTEE